MELVARDYSLTDSELVDFTGSFIDVLSEYTTELSEYGVTTAKVEELEAIADAFDGILPDDFYAVAVSTAVIERNNKRKEIAGLIQSVMLRIENVIPAMLYKYNRFMASELKSAPNHIFRDAADDFAEYVAEDLPALAGDGLTQAKLNAIEAAAAEFTALSKNVRKKMANRAKIAGQRVQKGNELYALVKKYADYGKDKFKNTPAIYNLFIIYTNAGVPKTPPAAPTVQVIDDFIEVIFSQNVTSVSIEIRTDPNGEFTEIYDGNNQPVAAPENYDYLEVKAFGRNAAGNGQTTTAVFYGIPPSPTNLRREGDIFMWGVDESVDEVEFDVSYDNGVTYNQVAVMPPTQKTYPWTPPSGTILARMRTKRNGVYSPYIVVPIVIP